MNYTQVWDALCQFVTQTFPELQVRKQYAPLDDIEELAQDDRPAVWVKLSSCNIASVNTQANYVEDSFTFQLILVWKLRGNINVPELDDKTNALQYFMSEFRHKGIKVGGVTLFFGLPTCDSPFDEDFIVSPGLFVSTVSVPVSVYRNLDLQPVTIQDENQHVESPVETQSGEG